MAIECDVLVVGGGPAGSSAARAAAQKGLDVICIEKKEEPGKPVQCAEGIGSYLLKHLPFNLPAFTLEWKIKGINFRYNNIEITKGGPFWKGYSVDRLKLESWLLSEAKNEGARISLSSELIGLDFNNEFEVNKAVIKTKNNKKVIHPNMVIAADGVNATTLKCIDKYNPNPGALVDCHAWEFHDVNLENPHFEEILVGEFVPGGYGFIFPKSRNKANIGIGGLYPEKDIEEYFNNFIETPFMKKILNGSKQVYNKSRYAVFDNLSEKQNYGNIYLVGDAANHNFKPFVEGILPGIISGDYIGSIADQLLSPDNSLDLDNYLNNLLPKLFKESDISKNLLHQLYSNWKKTDHLLFIALVSELFEIERLSELKSLEAIELEKKIISEIKN